MTDTNYLSHGDELQIGDVIVSKTGFGTQRRSVHRVTKKYAFVKYNDVAEGKYPRKYDMYFESLPRHQYSMVSYNVERARL